MTTATTTQLNAEIAARKAADIANATATAAEGKARLAGDKLNADAVAALTARVAALEGSMGNVILRIAAVEAHFTPPPSAGIYGPGIAMDSLNNSRIGASYASVLSYRWRAAVSSAVNAAIVEWRIGPPTGYSAGTNGSFRAGIKADDGTGHPTGSFLAYFDYTPGALAADHYIVRHAFGTPYVVTAGLLYHLVFTNTDADPVANYASLNCGYVFDNLSPRQAAHTDDYALLQSRNDQYGGAWQLSAHDTPILDLEYANGAHEGMGYVSAFPTQHAHITGTTTMARENFTVSGGDKTVTMIKVRPGRTSGTDPLLVRLETGAGTEIETVSIPASQVTVVPHPSIDTSGNWVGATFATSHVLTNGQTYHLRLSCAVTSEYTMYPILQRDGTDDGVHYLKSLRFTDGEGEFTTDSGGTWTQMYLYQPINMQFYFVTA